MSLLSRKGPAKTLHPVYLTEHFDYDSVAVVRSEFSKQKTENGCF